MSVELAFLQAAVELAERSVAEGGGPFGAVVVRDGEIVGRGCNRVTLDNDPSAHAEIQAIRDACGRLQRYSLEGCQLYVSCAPCTMCLSAVYWARLDAVFYAATREAAAEAGFDDLFIAEELARTPENRQLPVRRVAVETAGRPFELWMSKPDRVEY